MPQLRALLWPLLLLPAIAATGMPARASAAQSATAQPVRLQLKWHHQFQFAGYYAAQAQGYYRQEGLDVTILEGDQDRPPIQEVLAGRADFAVSDADVLLAYLRGEPLVVLAAIFQHSPYILMTRADSNIRKPSDLPGRTIMLSTEQGIAQLKAVFRREGIPLDAVNIVPHRWDNQLLVAGRVDAISAYSTVEPFQLRAAGVEPATIRAMDYGVDFYGDTLFTTRQYLEAHPRQVEAFRRASLRGWQYAMANPEEIIERILQMPGVRQRGITREMLRYEAQAMRELILPDLVDMGHMNPGRWETIARVYASIGMIEEMPPPQVIDQFVYDPDERRESRWLRPLLAALGAVVVAGAVTVAWNLQLRRVVARRTAELRVANETLEQRVAERSAEAERRAAQLRALATQLAHAEQRERRRIAQVLHDDLQQLLVAAKFNISIARTAPTANGGSLALQQVDDLLDQSLATARSLTTELSPSVLHRGSLADALQWLANWMQDTHGLAVRVDADEATNPQDDDVRLLLFQAVRELLFNVVKHAGVSEATVRLACVDAQVRAVVADEGAGFDASRGGWSDRGTGLGLLEIQERLELLGGRMEIDTAPGKGCRVAVTAPLRTGPPETGNPQAAAAHGGEAAPPALRLG